MGKVFALIVGFCGMVALIHTYYPKAWASGFKVGTQVLPFAVVGILFGLVIIYRAK